MYLSILSDRPVYEESRSPIPARVYMSDSSYEYSAVIIEIRQSKGLSIRRFG